MSTGELGPEFWTHDVFPQGFDHGVNQIETVSLGSGRVGVAWLDCDNSRCGAVAAKQSCTALYAVVDTITGTAGPITTLYERRYGELQLVANPATAEVLAVVGKKWGSFGAGLRAAIFLDTGEPLLPWTVLGGKDVVSPAAAATVDGFVVVADDWRPLDTPPAEPCAASCECSGNISVDPALGGVYAHELTSSGSVRSDLVAIGVVDDGHLPGGHYHDRRVLAVMRRDDELVVAAGQGKNMEAEIFVGRHDAWVSRGGFDSPTPMWIGVMGSTDTVAWLGSEPANDVEPAINSIVAGAWDGSSSMLTEPVDSFVLDVGPVATPAGISRTFLLRGIIDREASLNWKQFDLVEVTLD